MGFYLPYLAVGYLIHLDTGVVGLTTAVKIQEQGGYAVTVVADTFPSDPKTIKYTSLWAVRRRPFVFPALFKCTLARAHTTLVMQMEIQSSRVSATELYNLRICLT